MTRSMPRLFAVHLLLSLCAPALVCVGCSSGEGDIPLAPTAQVSGTVTVDGKPLTKEGLSLVFAPVTSEEQRVSLSAPSSASLTIHSDGTFSGEVPVGEHRVWAVVTGGNIDHYNLNAAKQTFGINPAYLETPSVENSAPRKFHEVTVKASGPNEYTFELGK